MMPQAPRRQRPAGDAGAGVLAAGRRLLRAPVMPQCSYTLMANRLRFVGCDPFRIACNRR